MRFTDLECSGSDRTNRKRKLSPELSTLAVPVLFTTQIVLWRMGSLTLPRMNGRILVKVPRR